jgi:predicted ATPase
MIIKRVILKNWKNFQKVEIDLSERNFIIGANASGKSNFLDVFRFMRDITKDSGGLQLAVKERDGVPKIRCIQARRESDIQLEFHLSNHITDAKPAWKYILGFKNVGGGIKDIEPQVTLEKVYSEEDGKWILNRSADNEQKDKEKLRFTYLEQINSNEKFRDVYNFFRNIQYLHIVPQLVREANSYMLASNKEDFYGRNLLERISRTKERTRISYLKKIEEFLKVAVPQLEKLEFIDRKNSLDGEAHFEARYKHWRPSGAKQSERQFSDGTLRIIGFMWALLDGTETILLEEPELYLNAEIVKQLPEFIHRFQRKRKSVRQVLITTHSFDLLDTKTINASEILMLNVTDEHGTEVIKASDNESASAKIKAGFSPAESVLPEIAPKNVRQSLSQISLFD